MSIEENELENIFNSLPRAVVVLEDHKIIFANAAVENIFGWAPKELLGKEMEMLYRNKVEFEQIDGSLYSRVEKERSYNEMYPCRHKDGRDRTCSIDISTTDEQWAKKRVVLMYEDITERIEAEKEEQENEEQYRNLIENTHEIVQSMSLDGKFLSVNKAWYKSFNYDESELKSLNLLEMVEEDSKEHFNEIFKKAVSGEPVLNQEICFTAKDAHVVILEGDLIPRTFYGKVINVRCFFRDITENRRTQQEITEKIRQLEMLNKMMTDREIKMIELKSKIKELQDQINAAKA